MKKSVPALIALTALLGVAACNKGNEQQTADTTTVPAADTVSGKAVPTTDTVVKTTTTSTDTVKGQANEDSVKKADSTKKKTSKKSSKKY